MHRKLISLTCAFTFLVVFAACASGPKEITGIIKSAEASKVNNMLEILITLEGHPETYLVHLKDTHKFGLTKGEKISTAGEFTVMMQEIAATKGWKVKLTYDAKNLGEENKAAIYPVTSLSRLDKK